MLSAVGPIPSFHAINFQTWLATKDHAKLYSEVLKVRFTALCQISKGEERINQGLENGL